MLNNQVKRRLAAVLMADIAGYSRLIGADDEGTLALLSAHHDQLIRPRIEQCRGSIVRTTGDGLLALFASSVDCLRCAVEIQRDMAERNAQVPPERRLEFRIGLSVGDIVEGDTIHGDGINVAARLEALAEVGGICVSDRVQEDARSSLDRLGVTFEDVGEQSLKNIAHPVRVFRVRPLGTERAAHGLPLPNAPSIAILPFANMSGDPEQEYFADGMVEEITTALSRIRWLFVIARNSSFTYKGRAVNVKQVGRELGVRYVLEGSVRKAAGRVRITGQLIDALTGIHIWADRFDGEFADIFELQDRIAESVVGAIEPKLMQVEIERAKRKPTESMDAYDHFLRGLSLVHQGTNQAQAEALRHFYRAIDLDTNFASAYAMAAFCFNARKSTGRMTDRDIEETERLARRAEEVGGDDGFALCEAGFARAVVLNDLDAGVALIDRGIEINSNLSVNWLCSGWVRNILGQPDVAITHFERAMRLSPIDPWMFSIQGGIAMAHFISGRDDEASDWAAKALRARPRYLSSLRIAAASNALAGRTAAANSAMRSLRQADPDLRLSNLASKIINRQTDIIGRLAEGLRKAGLPE